MGHALGLLGMPKDLAITARSSFKDNVNSAKGFRQHRHLLKVHQDGVPVLVDAKIAGVHVVLHEYYAFTA